MSLYWPSDRNRLQVEVDAHASSGSRLVLYLIGELDRAEVAALQHSVAQMIAERRPRRIILNTQRVTFLDAGGIRALLWCHRHAAQQGVVLTIGRTHRNVYRVLNVCDLLGFFGLAEKSPA